MVFYDVITCCSPHYLVQDKFECGCIGHPYGVTITVSRAVFALCPTIGQGAVTLLCHQCGTSVALGSNGVANLDVPEELERAAA